MNVQSTDREAVKNYLSTDKVAGRTQLLADLTTSCLVVNNVTLLSEFP